MRSALTTLATIGPNGQTVLSHIYGVVIRYLVQLWHLRLIRDRHKSFYYGTGRSAPRLRRHRAPPDGCHFVGRCGRAPCLTSDPTVSKHGAVRLRLRSPPVALAVALARSAPQVAEPCSPLHVSAATVAGTIYVLLQDQMGILGKLFGRSPTPAPAVSAATPAPVRTPRATRHSAATMHCPSSSLHTRCVASRCASMAGLRTSAYRCCA